MSQTNLRSQTHRNQLKPFILKEPSFSKSSGLQCYYPPFTASIGIHQFLFAEQLLARCDLKESFAGSKRNQRLPSPYSNDDPPKCHTDVLRNSAANLLKFHRSSLSLCGTLKKELSTGISKPFTTSSTHHAFKSPKKFPLTEKEN